MKGKTKTILAIGLAVAIVAVAAVGTVTFLKDNGRAAAAEEEDSSRTLPVTESNEGTNSGEQLNVPDNLNEGDNTPSVENAETTTDVGTVEPGTTNRTTTTTPTGTTTATTTTRTGETTTQTGEPAGTTIEQERLVSTTLNWSSTSLNANIGDKNINYTNMKYVVNYYKVKDKEELLNSKTDKAAYGTVVLVSEEDINENCPPGYKLDEESKLSTEINENEDTNVINVYFVPRNDTPYVVEYYLQNLEDEDFTLEVAENKTGITDDEVTAEEKEFEGFTLDESVEGTKKSGLIEGDGSLVLKLYYTRNSHTLTINYVYEDGSEAVPSYSNKVAYGAAYSVKSQEITGYSVSLDKVEGTMPNKDVTVTVTYTMVTYYVTYIVDGEPYGDPEGYNYTTEVTLKGNPEKEGYTFSGWSSQQVTIEDTTTKFDMPAEDVVIEGSFTINEYPYTIKYYYEQVDGSYSYNVNDDETGVADYKTEITSFKDKVVNSRIYKLGSVTPADDEGNAKLVIGVNENVLSVYYDRIRCNYEIRYYHDLIDDVNLIGTVTESAPNGKTIVADTTKYLDTLSGYEYVGEEAPSMVIRTNDANILSVVYTKIPNAPFTVEYYYEKVNSTDYEKHSDVTNEMGTAQITSQVTLNTKFNEEYDYTIQNSIDENCKTGFVFASVSTLSFTMTANSEDNVIKVYYNRVKYKVTYEYDNTAPEAANELLPTDNNEYKFGATVTVANYPEVYGYSFDGWKKGSDVLAAGATFTMPASNVTLVGSFTNIETTYTVQYYLKKLNEDGYDVQEENIEGVIGQNVEANTNKEFTGLVFDSENANNELSGTVLANGGLVLKVYYKRQLFTVTWKNEDGTVLELDENVEYGSHPSYDKETLPTKPDDTYYTYEFAGWNPELTDDTTVTSDLVYTAKYNGFIHQNISTIIKDKWQHYGDGNPFKGNPISVSVSEDRTKVVFTLKKGNPYNWILNGHGHNTFTNIYLITRDEAGEIVSRESLPKTTIRFEVGQEILFETTDGDIYVLVR